MSINIKTKDGLLRLDGGGGVIVDPELSETSENPVQNRVIANQFMDLEKEISGLNLENDDIKSSVQNLSGEIKTLKDSHVIASVDMTGKIVYTCFGKAEAPEIVYNANGANDLTVIVSTLGDVGHSKSGTFLVSCGTRSIVNMDVICLIPTVRKEVRFGYSVQGDYVLFWVKQEIWNYPVNFSLISRYNMEFGELQKITEIPQGYTEVPIKNIVVEEN